jgi:methionyl-tRNA formyltransferase
VSSLKIEILCSSDNHPVNVMLARWIERTKDYHSITLCRSTSDVRCGDILFLISCSDIVGKNIRDKFSKVLVLHASDLPKGRGWSPHIWEIAQGANSIVLSLLEASDKVDSGAIWCKKKIDIPKTALCDEINNILFDAEEAMLDFAIENFGIIQPKDQPSYEGSYYPKRTPEDSRLDPRESIENQFDLLRVCDSKRFPAFFDLRGKRFKIILEEF